MGNVVLERLETLVKSLQEARQRCTETMVEALREELRLEFPSLKAQLDQNPDSWERRKGYRALAVLEQLLTTPPPDVYSMSTSKEVGTDVLLEKQS